jgi:hypothetical protein
MPVNLVFTVVSNFDYVEHSQQNFSKIAKFLTIMDKNNVLITTCFSSFLMGGTTEGSPGEQ